MAGQLRVCSVGRAEREVLNEVRNCSMELDFMMGCIGIDELSIPKRLTQNLS
jgi:hypothetical protein